MTLDLVDTVWSAMHESEFYTPNDLSNTLGEPTEAIVRILEFLTRYGFAQKVTKWELIFRKVERSQPRRRIEDSPDCGRRLPY